MSQDRESHHTPLPGLVEKALSDYRTAQFHYGCRSADRQRLGRYDAPDAAAEWRALRKAIADALGDGSRRQPGETEGLDPVRDDSPAAPAATPASSDDLPLVALRSGEGTNTREEIERLRRALASDARVEAILVALLTPRGDPEDGTRDHLPRVLRDFLSEACGKAGLTGFEDGYAEGFAKALAASPTTENTPQGGEASGPGSRWTHVSTPPKVGGLYTVGGYLGGGALPRFFDYALATVILTVDGPSWSLRSEKRIPIEYWQDPGPHPEREAPALDLGTPQGREDGRAPKSVADRVLKAFEHVDAEDWAYLNSHFRHGGRDRFWRAVLEEVRIATQASAPSLDPAPRQDRQNDEGSEG